ncbi:AbgT family transporter [Rubeoparvulum massiliense]|uniref:AbgT family transporter n=1 Tax=Rubeoparvulum massiliense TaxID=1631346 RepID=UPI00065E2223|nr:AbgT family transporter [Rubeoparvulum massiliense]
MRFLDVVERVGNRLPHPFMIFIYLAVIMIALSWLASSLGAQVVHPGSGEEVTVQNMVSKEGLTFILSSMLKNFSGFQPLGLVLVMMLGMGLADKVGLIETFMRRVILNAPARLVTFAVVFAGVMGNLASDAAFVIVPPLAATVFYHLGRHPLAGLAAGFAGVGAGFTANLIPAGTDALMAGITTPIAQTITPGLEVSIVDNYYFMAFSVLVLSLVGTWVTERLVEPKLGVYEGEIQQALEEISPQEIRGLRRSGIAFLFYAAVIALITIPANGWLNSAPGEPFHKSPFFQGIVPLILFAVVIMAITYGVTVGRIKGSRDIPHLMGEAMKDMAGFIVLIFAAAQFIAYFKYSNLDIWLAVKGADLLTALNLTGMSTIIGFIILTAFLNLFIFSGSAQWALMAPVFVPMFMILNYDPAFIQLAYRIGDSSTNVITPLNPYLPIILIAMRQYSKNAGFGTLMSTMLPYSIFFLISWTVLMVAWVLLGIPIGPGIGMLMR